MMRLYNCFLTAAMLIALLACQNKTIIKMEDGVSLSLAESRARSIQEIAYTLDFDIPAALDERVKGTLSLSFDWQGKGDLQLDFQGPFDGNCVVNGADQHVVYQNEHIIIPAKLLKQGKNQVSLSFVNHDKSLNRHADYLYTLFVPDHARSVFPCFDQPNLKARFSLSLHIPKEWVAVSGGKVKEERQDATKKHLTFETTDLIPTYLFSFVAGQFEVKEETRNARTVHAYYRETDPKKVAQFPTIFDEVFLSLDWLEDYTSITYPFDKLDIVILPGFQFGGMEHVGAIQFNDKRMFVSEHPTPDEELSRMELIAHETSHMWFGDLVTMRWFNDVWTKEVFANYMAAKISHSHFTAINHDLNFIKDYHITAFAEDRTDGTHPIQQPLDNLKNAGLVYGNIIYDKAPVMMRKLEEQMGSEAFQRGLQHYLKQFSYANATWDDLIAILDKEAPEANLPLFSEAWVKQKGMPVVTISVDNGTLTVEQKDPYERGICWQQKFAVGLVMADGKIVTQPIDMQTARVQFAVPAETVEVIPNYDGKGYGRFVSTNMDWQLAHWMQEPTEVSRLAMLLNIYEAYLAHQVSPIDCYRSMTNGLKSEQNALIASAICGYLGSVMDDLRGNERLEAEQELWQLGKAHSLTSCRQRLMRLMFGLATEPKVVEEVYALWKTQNNPLLNVNDYMTMAYQLALRMPDQWLEIVDLQCSRLTNVDLQREFDFISRACNPDEQAQQALFESLLEPENRAVEPWVQRLLALLNSSLREPFNNRFILPGLEELQEVQQTGDIFFPKNWVLNLLGGHQSEEAQQLVLQFLANHPDYPQALKNKLLMAAYPLMNKQF